MAEAGNYRLRKEGAVMNNYLLLIIIIAVLWVYARLVRWDRCSGTACGSALEGKVESRPMVAVRVVGGRTPGAIPHAYTES